MIDPHQVPLALYVHLPWCVRKCPYCDFNSHAVPASGLPEQAYLHALLEDLEFAAEEAQTRELVSVFFGGGTPSLFSSSSIDKVLTRARELLPVAANLEVTLEANPGTIERGRFTDYAAAGVTRVSLGAQSFSARKLALLGRIHSVDEIDKAVADLAAAGLDNFNLDLMYALPEQSVDEALHDLARAVALGPAHISHYQLTLEPDTPFAKRPPANLPDDDVSFAMQEACQAYLAQHGYAQYEVSAYARDGRRCEHNLVYWRFGDYLGIGAGAHGKLTRADGSAIDRTVRARHPAQYLAARSPRNRHDRASGRGAGRHSFRVLPEHAAVAGRIHRRSLRAPHRHAAHGAAAPPGRGVCAGTTRERGRPLVREPTRPPLPEPTTSSIFAGLTDIYAPNHPRRLQARLAVALFMLATVTRMG